MISVLVPFKGDGGRRDQLFEYVQDWWAANFLIDTDEFIVGVDHGEPFSRSRARNDAFEASSGDIIIIADADTVPTAPGLHKAIRAIRSGDASWVIPYAGGRYYNLAEDATDRILAGADPAEPTDPRDWEHKLTSWAGCLVMPRDAYIAAGGYDDRFVGWGGEDNAFQLCLDRLCGPHSRVDSYILHLWHPRGDADFSQPSWPENAALLRQYQAAKTAEGMRHVRFSS